MSKSSLFEKIKSTAEKSYNRNPIVRFHTTRIKNLPSILENGLTPRNGGGYQDLIGDDSFHRGTAVFTETRGPGNTKGWGNDQYFPSSNENLVKLELEIPKDKYSNLTRMDENPEIKSKYVSKHGDRLVGVNHGGRTDMFTEDIDPSFIKNIWVSNQDNKSMFKKIPVNEFANKMNCQEYGPECDEVLEILKNRR